MKRITPFWLTVVRTVARAGLFFAHPIFRVSGRENIPQGACVICCNHRGAADPVWTVCAIKPRQMFRVMAKEQVLQVPVFKYFFQWLGLIPVRRGAADVTAIKTAMKALKDGEQLLIYPEGTRVKPGTVVEPKTGAVMLAARTNSVVVPVYLETERKWLSPMRAVIGKPYALEFAGAKPTSDELQTLTDSLMKTIYALGESK